MQRKTTSRKRSKRTSRRAKSEASELKPNQHKALHALVAGSTKTEAAKAAGVDRTTIYQWFSDPRFVAEFNRVRTENGAAAAEELRALSLLAASTIRCILQNPQESSTVRLRAALAVLEKVPIDVGAIGATTPEGVVKAREKYVKDVAQYEMIHAIPTIGPIKPL